LRRLGEVPTYALTDNERTVSVDHVAGVTVRHPEIVAVKQHYGMSIRTFHPNGSAVQRQVEGDGAHREGRPGSPGCSPVVRAPTAPLMNSTANNPHKSARIPNRRTPSSSSSRTPIRRRHSRDRAARARSSTSGAKTSDGNPTLTLTEALGAAR
jgi:hypothetical protein